MKIFRAKACRSMARDGWCILFQHPFKTDERGRSYPFVKRYMHTENEQEIARLVDEMNDLLRMEEYWTSAVKGRAKARYDERVVNAFYDDDVIEQPLFDLPKKEEGYHYLNVIGEKGSGKTSFIRQLLYIHSEREKFPLTARNGKYSVTYMTTNHLLYEAIIQFIPRHIAKRQLEEIILKSAEAYLSDGGTDYDLVFELLHTAHPLCIRSLLGDLPYKPRYFSDESIPWNHDGEQSFKQYIEIIKKEAEEAAELAKVEQKDFETVFLEKEACQSLIEQMMTQIESAFKGDYDGEWGYGENDWPMHYRIKTESRAHYFASLYKMTTEKEGEKSQLCYSLIDHIQVRIPLQEANVVIREYDQYEMTKEICESFSKADTILFVQHALRDVNVGWMNNLLTYGQAEKMHVMFTHGDLLKAEACMTDYAKKHHLVSKIEQALKPLAPHVKKQLQYYLTAGTVRLLSNINCTTEDNQPLNEARQYFLELPKQTEEQVSLHPIYLNITIPQAIHEAVKKITVPYIRKWQCLDFANGNGEVLVSVLTSTIAQSFYDRFFSNSSGWSSSYHSVTDRQRVIQSMTAQFTTLLHHYLTTELITNCEKEWRALYHESEAHRSYKISQLIHKTIPTQEQIYEEKTFLNMIYHLTKHIVEEAGGVFIH
ncbi:ATP-binding protein [Priestia megaterium]|nr:ATP-binding protein [Priestia megaterium]